MHPRVPRLLRIISEKDYWQGALRMNPDDIDWENHKFYDFFTISKERFMSPDKFKSVIFSFVYLITADNWNQTN